MLTILGAVASPRLNKRQRRRLLPTVLLLASGLSAQAALPTLVSTNLCTDQAVLSLADPTQILALSPKSHDRRYTSMAEQARNYPINHASAEEVLAWHPDLVVTSRPWAGSRHGRLLAKHGIRLLVLPGNPHTLADMNAAIRLLAAALGRTEAGERLIGDLRRRVRALPRHDSTVIYLRPNGGSAGQDTYVDTVFQWLGLRNLSAAEGIHGWGRFPLEYLVVQPPDVIVTSFFDLRRPLRKSLYGRHPALRDLLAQRPHIDIPSADWACGDWHLIQVAETIARSLDALVASGRLGAP
ncbi:MAG: ABC transporter substrate-binding protein [Gammaproteobacteria bacterium]|nr:ABC transporter substrate-binding protein [Gammaproteobacteria bacterium]